jgi:Class II flagellar assembly regulator
MRVAGTARTGASSYQSVGKTGQGSGFTVPSAGTRAPAMASAGAISAPALDALLALQSVDTVGERRRRELARGRTLLDSLDLMKIGLLDGSIPPIALAQLRAALAAERQAVDDAALEDILDAIELRAEVEIAKLESARRSDSPDAA